jgi:hypothetical protein
LSNITDALCEYFGFLAQNCGLLLPPQSRFISNESEIAAVIVSVNLAFNEMPKTRMREPAGFGLTIVRNTSFRREGAGFRGNLDCSRRGKELNSVGVNQARNS